jgi:hypothetical protein
VSRIRHIVLLGDSIFDNENYVPPGRDVISHLRERLEPGSQATLLAVDGATIDDVAHQVPEIPDDATHLVLSVGGNDALNLMHVLPDETRTIADALAKLSMLQERFATAYRGLIGLLLAVQKPLVVCTIYYPPTFEYEFGGLVAPGLSAFNDTILTIAFEERLSVIETRLVCFEESDFESAIEPSESGGAKTAEALVKALGIEPSLPRSEVYAT